MEGNDMQTAQEDIRIAPLQVVEPEPGQNLVDLGMEREAHMADGQVDLILALTARARTQTQ
jgi:metal-sulfur cluster biosynthetic enzyme